MRSNPVCRRIQFWNAAARPAVLLALVFLLAPLGRGGDALNFWKNYFVTGDYAMAGVGLRGTGQSGWATGTLNMTGVPCTSGPGAFSTEPCSANGAIASDIVAAFLYWETEETTQATTASGYFDGNAITGSATGTVNNPSCDGSNGSVGASGTYAHVYRADVLPFLAIDTVNSVHLANGKHTIKFADSGKSGTLPNTNGATLVVVYKVVVPGNPGIFPLKSVVFYDGSYTLAKSTAAFTQTVGGFYQSTGFGATMAQIVGNGQPGFDENLTVNGSPVSGNSGPFNGSVGVRWDNPSFNISLAPNAATYSTEATIQNTSDVCVTWAAVVTSTPVVDTDSDGLLDIWETNGIHLNTTTSPATFGGCADYPTDPCVDLPSMGANVFQKDIFIQIDWMYENGGQGLTGGLDGQGTHNHKPTESALNMVCSQFSSHGIALHFDIGNNYQGQPCVVPYKTDKYGHQITAGGNQVNETTWICQNSSTVTCVYNQPYAILSFKRGFQDVRDGDPLLTPPVNGLFPNIRKDSFHYALFSHALSGPFSATGTPLTTAPSSVSGIADRPGGDLMVTLGLWRTDVPTTDMVGTDLIQAGTLMHELGHNLDLSHYGLYRTPNCAPEYSSVMNYMYQTRGLTDAQGNEHIDYSYGLVIPPLSENNPTPLLFPLLYRVRYYAPWNSNIDTQGQIAQTFCDGSPITNGAQAIRLESAGLAAPDWSNGTGYKTSPPLDLNFDGVYGQTFYDQPDWFSLNLQQIGGRPNSGGASVDVGFSDAGFSDAGFSDAGFSDAGFSDAGFSDAGFSDAGVTDGDIDLNTEISSGAPSPTVLTVANTISSNQLSWTPPSAGTVQNYNVYRCAVISPATTCTFATTPFASAPGGTATPGYTDTVNNQTGSGEGGTAVCGTNTCYNTTYDYQVTAVFSVTNSNNSTTTSESLPTNSVSSEVTHLFVIAGSASVVYGNTIPAPTFTTYGDVASSLSASAVTCVYAAGTPRNVGTYVITCSGPASTSATDGVTYNAAYLTYTPGTLTITQRPITVTAAASTKQYDGGITSPAIPTITAGTLAYSDTPNFSETYDNKNVGTTHVMTPAGTVNDGNGGANYKVTFVTISTGIITPAPLSITVTGSQTYGGTNIVYTPAYNAFVGTDNAGNALTGTLACGTTATAGSPVAGSYTVQGCSGLSALNSNYTITYAYGAFIVNKAPLLAVISGSETYGGTNQVFAPSSFGPPGFVNGDNSSVVSGTLSCTASKTLAVNSYPNAISGCTGLVAANYLISYSSGTFTVNPAPLVIAVSGSQTYGQANQSFIITGYATLVNGDTASSLTGSLLCSAPAGLSANVYVNVATCSGITDPNYSISYATTFTVLKAVAQVTLSNMTQPYTGSPLTPTATTVPAGLAIVWTGAPDTNVGQYPVTATVNDPNYTGSASGTFVIQISGLSNFSLAGSGNGGVPVLIDNNMNLELANDIGGEASAGWYPTELNVAGGFSTTFTFQITPAFNGQQNIADGMAFVIQAGQGLTAVGSGGGDIGYDGIPNSIAVEFDTFQNSSNNDPASPHIGIQSNGTGPNSANHGTTGNLGADLSGGAVVATFADGAVHTVTITYDGSSTLNVYLDGGPAAIASATVNLGTLLNLDSGTNAYVGFTGATGALEENTTVLSWTWTPGPPAQQ